MKDLLDIFGGHAQPRRRELRSQSDAMSLALLQSHRNWGQYLSRPQQSFRQRLFLHCRNKSLHLETIINPSFLVTCGNLLVV